MPLRKKINKGKEPELLFPNLVKIKTEPGESSSSSEPKVKVESSSEPPQDNDTPIIMNRPASAGPREGPSPSPFTGQQAMTPPRTIRPAPTPVNTPADQPSRPLPSSLLIPSPGDYKHNNWEAVLPHTAKCDFCSDHNTRVMQRCIPCNHQVCQACVPKIDRNKHIVDMDKFIWDPALVPKKNKANKANKASKSRAVLPAARPSMSSFGPSSSGSGRDSANSAIAATNNTLRAITPRLRGPASGERLVTEEEKRGWYNPQPRPSSTQGMEPPATGKRRYDAIVPYAPNEGESSTSKNISKRPRQSARVARREYVYDDDDGYDGSDTTDYAPMTEEYAAKNSQRLDLAPYPILGNVSASQQGPVESDAKREMEGARRGIQERQRLTSQVACPNTLNTPEQMTGGHRIATPSFIRSSRVPPPGSEPENPCDEVKDQYEQFLSVHVPGKNSHVPTGAGELAANSFSATVAGGYSFNLNMDAIFEQAAEQIKTEHDAKLAAFNLDMERAWDTNTKLIELRAQGKEAEAKEIFKIGRILAAMKAGITLPKDDEPVGRT